MTRRILLVEDDGVTVEVAAGILVAKGFEVDVANDGVSGVEKLCKGGYALALIDDHLPEIDGYPSARVMGRMLPAGERRKLVALTSERVMSKEGRRAYEAMRQPFVENLMAALGEDAHMHEQGEASYVVAPDIGPEEFAAVEAALVGRCAGAAGAALGPRLSILEAA